MGSRTTTGALGLLLAVGGAGCIDDAWAQHAADAGRGSNPDAGRRPTPGPGVVAPVRRGDAGAVTLPDAGVVLGAFWGDTIDDSFGRGALGRTGRSTLLPRDGGAVGGLTGVGGLIGRGAGPGGTDEHRGMGRLGARRDAGAPRR